MSYLDDASLVVIPSGYKPSTVFAVKPTDGTGDLTFTRSNDTATRVGPDGLIEKVRTNIALYSEEFNNAYWTKTNTTITANATTAPDGSLTADKLVETAALGDHAVARVGGMTAAGVYALSVFAKAGERTRIAIGNSSAAHYAIFDLSLGTVVQASQGTVTNGTISSIDANGFYRVSCTITVASAASVVLNLVSTGTTISYTGDGTSGLFIWGAQLETGDIATPYIGPTLGSAVSVGPVANVPRLDYLGSSCPRLLLEPQRTNLITFSEQLNLWTGANVTITSNTSQSPDGYQNADNVNITGTNGYWRRGSLTLASSTSYAASIFVKKSATTGTKTFRFYYNNNAGAPNNGVWNCVVDLTNITATTTSAGTAVTGRPTILSTNLVDYGNDWYRVEVAFTTGSGAGNSGSEIGLQTNGVVVVDFDAYGAQLEAGAYATSYIPTLGAAVTRGADAASKTGISSLIGQTEGTMYAEISAQQAGSSSAWWNLGDDGTLTNWIFFGKDNTKWRAHIRTGGTVHFDSQATSIIDNAPTKIALAYKSGNSALYINGVQVAANSATFTVTANMGQLTTGFTGSPAISDAMKTSELMIFKTRLTNAQLAELTTL